MFVEHKEAGEKQHDREHYRVLKLSEAMRIGASMREQCFGNLFEGGKSCALGAAYEGVYGHPGINGQFHTPIGDGDVCLLDMLYRAFPCLAERMEGDKVLAAIYRRNDGGKSREEIADWLESRGF